MTIYFNLVCWSCGKKRGVEASRHPEFAFEVAQMADVAQRMKGCDCGAISTHDKTKA